MIVEYRTGNLFNTEIKTIMHGCNLKGVMGAGIAREFMKRYPAMFEEYCKRCSDGRFTLGSVFPWQSEDKLVLNLGTQPYPGPCASLTAIETCLLKVAEGCASLGVVEVAMPRIGAGLGGLEWEDVKSVIETVAEKNQQAKFVVYSL